MGPPPPPVTLHYPLPTTHYPLPTTHYPPPPIRHPPHPVRHPPPLTTITIHTRPLPAPTTHLLSSFRISHQRLQYLTKWGEAGQNGHPWEDTARCARTLLEIFGERSQLDLLRPPSKYLDEVRAQCSRYRPKIGHFAQPRSMHLSFTRVPFSTA